MKNVWLAASAATALLLPAFGQAQTAKALPVDVRHFLEQRELCDHFGSEDPYDEARRRYLARQVRRYCTGTERHLAHLKRKYAKNPAVMSELGKLDERTE